MYHIYIHTYIIYKSVPSENNFKIYTYSLQIFRVCLQKLGEIYAILMYQYLLLSG